MPYQSTIRAQLVSTNAEPAPPQRGSPGAVNIRYSLTTMILLHEKMKKPKKSLKRYPYKCSDGSKVWMDLDPNIEPRLVWMRRMIRWATGDQEIRKEYRKLYELPTLEFRGDRHRPEQIGESFRCPERPPGWGGDWIAILASVYQKYRKPLERVLQTDIEDARLTSFGLSYEAMRSCALLGQHWQMAYVHKACCNRHCAFLKAETRRVESVVPSLYLYPPASGSDPPDIQARIDIESGLARLDLTDAYIVRRHVLDGASFSEIGRPLVLDTSTVQRRYRRALASLRLWLRDYDLGSSGHLRTERVAA